MTDVMMCLGCGCYFHVQDLCDTPCSDCGGVCRVCEDCAAGPARKMCDACIDASLPWLAVYVRLRIEAQLN